MDKTELAEYIARRVFQDKKDLNREPYIDHISRVASNFREPYLIQAAWLHDLMEDFPEWTFDQIKALFWEDVANLVSLLTRKDGEDYFDYIRRIKTNYSATRIKIADLKDNLNVLRYELKPELDTSDLIRISKYHKANWILNHEKPQEVNNG
jgi:(p)ppGpp synthase/HD superfamily hydrolase